LIGFHLADVLALLIIITLTGRFHWLRRCACNSDSIYAWRMYM